MKTHETHEAIHETGHHGHHDESHGSKKNKIIALIISVLAVALAIIEASGKNAQNTSISANIQASDLWAFYQAKTIRQTSFRNDADVLELLAPGGIGEPRNEQIKNKITEWRSVATRYDSEPDKGDGRKELMEKAKSVEHHRDVALSSYHMFEYGAAAIEIAIVLCSAGVVIDMLGLVFLASGFGLIGVGFGLIGWLSPGLFHV